jgi:hypothetical protein
LDSLEKRCLKKSSHSPAAAGRTADYAALGDGMIAEGLAVYAAAARNFLNHILDGEKP